MVDIDSLSAAMDRAGMPADFRWRSFMMHLASMEAHDFLSKEQREQLKELFDLILEGRDYSGEQFRTVFMRQQNILNAPLKAELQSAFEEALDRVHEFKNLLLQRKDDVRELEVETIKTVETETSFEAMVESVKSGFGGLISKMESDAKGLVEMSMTDALTRLPNRRAFDLALTKWFKASRNGTAPLTLLMADIDYFKNFNDEYGHRIGDQALVTVAAILREALRPTGPGPMDENRHAMCARYGGEEFAIILVGYRSKEAMELAEELCSRVGWYNFVIRDAGGRILKNRIRLTISVGGARCLGHWETADQLLEAADNNLYVAKRSGRNRVHLCSQ
ncbi:GGDEF domain-containing protein [Desulfoplanes sp.]